MAASTRSAWIEAWEADLVPSAAAARSAARARTQFRSTRYYGRQATARLPQPDRGTERSRALPELKVVARRRTRWPVIAVALVFAAALLGFAVISPILISAAATEVESAVGRAEAREHELAAATASLSAKISALSAPERVAEVASQLGLGPAEAVRYVDPDAAGAAVEGDTTPAGR